MKTQIDNVKDIMKIIQLYCNEAIQESEVKEILSCYYKENNDALNGSDGYAAGIQSGLTSQSPCYGRNPWRIINKLIISGVKSFPLLDVESIEKLIYSHVHYIFIQDHQPESGDKFSAIYNLSYENMTAEMNKVGQFNYNTQEWEWIAPFKKNSKTEIGGE